MARRPKSKGSKKGRRTHSGARGKRSVSTKKRRLRRRLLLVLVLLGGALGLYAFDRSGPTETVPAKVVRVETYPHTPRGGQTHTHTDVVIEFEGGQHTLESVKGLAEGEWIEVGIRRGRLSGSPRYESFRGTAAFDPLQPEAELPEPWEYDLVQDRHWDPIHKHWHDGPPPAKRP